MLPQEIRKMEQENEALKEIVAELKRSGEGKKLPRACESCKFYTQHYVKVEHSRYIKTYCGHCAHGRLKKGKKPDDFCNYFEPGEGGVMI